MDVEVARVAGLDVHKAQVTACVRAPAGAGARAQTIRQFQTVTHDLRRLRDWLRAEKVTLVVMEATGVYWRPVWHVLEEVEGWVLMLVNPQHVKNLPGRKTDVCDSAWLAQLGECGLLRGSFVPPQPIAKLREFTRYRKALVGERGREAQRVQKLLEDAGIKLSTVATNVLGVSGRRMLEALIAGERDPARLADLAAGLLRKKLRALRDALEGRFDADHHAVLLRMHLDHLDALSTLIEKVEAQIDRLMAPFADKAGRICTVPGFGARTSNIVISEIGADMTRFPTPKHLASWAKICPSNNESAGKHRSGHTGQGNPYLRDALVEAAWAASRTKNTYPAAQYQHFCRRFGHDTRGRKRAIVAVAHTLLTIVWTVLHDDRDYTDLGPDWFNKINTKNTKRRRDQAIRQLEADGYTVIAPAA